MRTCNQCKETKPLTCDFFFTYKAKKTNEIRFETTCRECRKVRRTENARKRRQDPVYKERQRVYMHEHNKRHYAANLEMYKTKYEKHKDRFLEMKRKKYNTPEYKARQKELSQKRYKNPVYRIGRSVSKRIHETIKDKNYDSWIDCVGYSVRELMIHIEKQFRPGMTWDNYGPIWHLDHIRPMSSFVFESKDDPQFKECWALSNLQPLFKHENLSKGNRYIRSNASDKQC